MVYVVTNRGGLSCVKITGRQNPSNLNIPQANHVGHARHIHTAVLGPSHE